MKNIIINILLLALIILLLFATSCTKQYSENPTCKRYLELIDKFDGEMIYMRTDTVYPNGRLNNVACDSELLKLINFIPRVEGCENGYQKIRFVII